MQKIIYSSRATGPMTPDDLAALLVVARSRNAAEDVTGLLLYAEGSFLQLLEGPDAAVEEIYARIVTDERHEDIRLMTRAPITHRACPEWTMGFKHPDEDDLAEYLPGFTPATLYPLASTELITTTEAAEDLLHMYGWNTGLRAVQHRRLRRESR